MSKTDETTGQTHTHVFVCCERRGKQSSPCTNPWRQRKLVSNIEKKFWSSKSKQPPHTTNIDDTTEKLATHHAISMTHLRSCTHQMKRVLTKTRTSAYLTHTCVPREEQKRVCSEGAYHTVPLVDLQEDWFNPDNCWKEPLALRIRCRIRKMSGQAKWKQ